MHEIEKRRKSKLLEQITACYRVHWVTNGDRDPHKSAWVKPGERELIWALARNHYTRVEVTNLFVLSGLLHLDINHLLATLLSPPFPVSCWLATKLPTRFFHSVFTEKTSCLCLGDVDKYICLSWKRLYNRMRDGHHLRSRGGNLKSYLSVTVHGTQVEQWVKSGGSISTPNFLSEKLKSYWQETAKVKIFLTSQHIINILVNNCVITLTLTQS